MHFTQTELKIIKYALEWMNNPDTFETDHNEFNDIWKKSFGNLKLETVTKAHKKLLEKFE